MGGLSKAYLIGYNVLSCLGWAWLLSVSANTLMLTELSIEKRSETLFEIIRFPLTIIQSAAILEIVHAMIGLVPSSVITTMIQVASRLAVMYMFSLQAESSQRHWSLFLMVISWSLAEVPRYMFYAVNLIPATSGAKMPYILFFLRYSLFLVLYPCGISGEMLQIANSHETYKERHMEFMIRLSHVLLCMYIPGSPYMILNMWSNRKKSFKKRAAELDPTKAAASQPKQVGLVWPITDKVTGERSSTVINKGAFAESIRSVNESAAAKVLKEKNWRHGYAKHVLAQVQESCVSPEAALSIAKAGLQYVHNTFEFISTENADTGVSVPFSRAMETLFGKQTYETGMIKGQGDLVKAPKLSIPYKGRNLTGDDLVKQLDKWVAQGTMEKSAADSLKECQKNEESWLNLSTKYFVLLGATSAMGPLEELLALGANIVAIDIDRSPVWEKLILKAKRSPGTLYFPMKKKQSECKNEREVFENSGCNLLTEAPRIATWLVNDVLLDKNFTIGNYTYLDGALHVQLSVACDAIIQALCNKRGKGTSIAFLCTPTDDHLIPKDAVEQARKNLKNAPLWQQIIYKMGFLKSNSKLAPINSLHIVDGVVIPQGPNYILAKRIQHWRSIVARSEGHVVSTNVAPSTNTVSVTSNALFAAGYEGWKHFSALEVMESNTSKASMCGLMVYDLCSTTSPANPKVSLNNPLELMMYGSFHGGIWRAAFTADSTGPVAVVATYTRRYSPVIVLFLAGVVSTVNYIVYGAGVPRGVL